MTKKLFISLILSFSLLILSNVESKGQCTCPNSNYQQASFQMTLANGCPITVNYCRLCHPTGNPEARLCSIEIPYTNINCQNMVIDSYFWAQVRLEMVKYIYYNCISLEVLPCPHQTLVDIYSASCYYMLDNPIAQMIEIKPCPYDPGLCLQEWEICYDIDEDIVTYSPKGEPYLLEEGNCSGPPPIIEYISTPSDCFNSCY